MPLHSWLPRAHPLAPAHVSALMSGVMIKLALYGLIRVLFEWAAPVPQWVGLVLLAIGALSAVGGVLYALFQHELKRLLAFHSIENVGIIVLGLGASLVFESIGQRQWSAIAFAAALLHIAQPRGVQGAAVPRGGVVLRRGRGASTLDRLGGLLRRMPWTGGAFAIGAMAIAGLPPLNGFASEWMTLQALLHVAVYGPFGVAACGGDRRGRARGDRGARGALLREGDRAGAARSAASRRMCPGARDDGRTARPAGLPRRAVRAARDRAGAAWYRRSRGSVPGVSSWCAGPGSICRGPAGCRRSRLRSRSWWSSRACIAPAVAVAPPRRRRGRAGSPSSRRSPGPRPGSPSRCG